MDTYARNAGGKMRGKRAKEIRKMVYFMGKPKPSFADENGTLHVDMLRAIYQNTKKHYKEHMKGDALAKLLAQSIDNMGGKHGNTGN
jgi:hypothetical protein